VALHSKQKIEMKKIDGILQAFGKLFAKHPGKAIILICVLLFAVGFLTVSTCRFSRKNGQVEFEFSKDRLDIEAIKR